MDQLLQLAEIALIFVGFVAVFIAVTRSPSGMSQIESYYARSILIVSVMSAFIALAPVCLAQLGVGEPGLWRSASSLALLISIAGAGFQIPTCVDVFRAQPPMPDVLTISAGWLVAIAGMGALLLNATGWGVVPGVGPLFLSVVLFLSIGAVAFLIMVFRRLGTTAA